MALKSCSECGAQVSTSASKCPKCGKKLKHTGLYLCIVILVSGLAIVLGVGAAASIKGGSAVNLVWNNYKNTIPSEENRENKITLEKFNQIENGMTYEEVVSIIGEEGTLSTESSYGNQTMRIYSWYASDGISNATITFMNGNVKGKSQIGLK